MSAQQNSRNPHSVLVNLGSIAAADTVAAMRTSRKIAIKGVYLANSADIAASDTNYVQVSLKNGSDVIAEIDSREAHEDGLSDGVFKALNLVEAQLEVAKGTSLTVEYAEAGTVALTAAQLQIDYEVLEQVD